MHRLLGAGCTRQSCRFCFVLTESPDAKCIATAVRSRQRRNVLAQLLHRLPRNVDTRRTPTRPRADLSDLSTADHWRTTEQVSHNQLSALFFILLFTTHRAFGNREHACNLLVPTFVATHVGVLPAFLLSPTARSDSVLYARARSAADRTQTGDASEHKVARGARRCERG